MTIQKRGLLSFNQAAYEAMGRPEAVELLYSAHQRVIAIRPVDPAQVSHASPFRGLGGKSNAQATTMLVAATAFTAHYEINTTRSTRYDVEVQDRVALIDLKQEGTVVSVERKARKEDSKRACT